MIQPVGDPALRIFADINFIMLFIKVIEYIHSLEEFLGTSHILIHIEILTETTSSGDKTKNSVAAT